VVWRDLSLESTLALASDDAKLNLLREGSQGGKAPIPPARTPTR
jgi:hypothetical protein